MTHVSTPQLHRLRLGELGPAERAPIEAHLASCAVCARRLDHQEAARAAFVATPVPAAIRALAERPPSFWERLGRLRAAVLVVPVAAALAVALRAPPEPTERTKGELHHSAPALEAERPKGVGPTLEAWVQTGASARPLYTDETVSSGTRIQLRYDAGSHRFVTFAGRDGQGVVEIYGTVTSQGPGLAPAPFALTLDDTPGQQAFFAVLTDTRPDPSAVLSALAATPARMERGQITTLLIRKE